MADNDARAFPSYSHGDGMTLRDYFAAQAMETAYHFFADGYCGLHDGHVEVDEHSAATVAAVAYELADAMMKARGER